MKLKRHHIEVLEARITPAPVFTAFNLLSDLDGDNGFNVLGGGAGVNVEITAVANAGDVNGDGIKDLLIGIPSESTNSKGRVALIFGKSSGFPTDLNLDSLGTDGVVITGQVNFDRLGTSLAGVGDVNGDGFDDFVIGAPGHDVGVAASERGAAYVIFGKASWGATLALGTLDGTNGFKINGDTRRTGNNGIAQAVGGYNLAGAGAGGDFNGDGFDDILIGAQDIQAFAAGGASSGAAFIIFGQNTNTGTGGAAFTSPLSVANLNGANGLMIASSLQNDFMGSEVGFVGDVNGDGLTDLSIGNHSPAVPNLGDRRSFIVFGKETGNPAFINLDALTAAQGFAGPEPTNVNFVGPIAYGSEYVMRDIDGDGDQDLGVSFVHQRFLDDAIQGYTFVKNTGAGYTTNPFGNLSKELRTAMVGFSNVSVDSRLYDLGDFNGDGFYDLSAFPSEFRVTAPFAGVFEGVAPTKTYVANNGTNSTGVEFTGLQLPGGFLEPQVFFVGDISGDGIDDALVLPAPSTGTATAPNAYVVFGDAFNPSDNGKSVTYTDVDGDKVTVKTSAGQFTRDMFHFASPAGAVPTGQVIDLLDIAAGDAASDAAFAGANITVSVKKGANGDGRANLGAINATGIDLGNVVIKGGLGAIDAGDSDFEEPGIKKLDVYRFGGMGVPSSDIVGRIGSIIVDTEFEGAALNVTGAATEGVSSIKIAGDFSGDITLAGPLGSFKSADILDGAKLVVNGTSTKKTSITAVQIGNGVLIDLAATLGKLTAKQVGTATIEAARIDTVNVSGDTKLALPGNFGASVSSPGGIGSLKVKGAFSGDIDLVGPLATLGTFKSGDILTGATINVDGASTKKTSIAAHVIESGVVIDIASVIGKLSAARVDFATIVADQIGTLSVTGDTKLGIRGDFGGSITLDNANVGDGSVKVLGTVKIAGEFHDGKIIVAGTVGSFTAAAMKDAALFAGYTPTNIAQPLAGGTFLPDAEIKSFTITGKVALPLAVPAAASMDDSFVIANRLGKVSLATIDSTTGAVPWGFAYRDAVKSLKVKDPEFAYDVDAGGQQSLDDFSVRQLP